MANPSHRAPRHSRTTVWSRLGIGAVAMIALMLSTAPAVLAAEVTTPVETACVPTATVPCPETDATPTAPEPDPETSPATEPALSDAVDEVESTPAANPTEPVSARSLLTSTLVKTARTSALVTIAATTTGTDATSGMTYSYDPANVGAGATVTGYNGSAGTDITIGATVTFDTVTYDVTAIGNNALQGKGLTSVAMPDTVITIGSWAFADNQIAAVSIPDAVTAINSGTFANNHLTTITIGDSVTTVGSYAFVQNHLRTATIGDSVITISDSVFAYNQLTAVTIGDSVTTIGNFAFSENQLTSIAVPDSTTTIGLYAFADNAMLTSVAIEGAGPTTVSARGATGSFGAGDVIIHPECAYAESFSSSWYGYTVDPTKVLTFDLNGHGSAIAPASVTCGVAATAPTPPTETGWAFTGWYADADLSTHYDFSDPISDDLTLYAGWGQPAAIAGSSTVTFTVGETAAWTPTSVAGNPAPTVTADTLPDGLTLDEDTGAIGGTPTTAGVTVVTLSVNNGIGDPAPLKLTITVETEITSFTLSTDKAVYAPGAAITITGGGLPEGTAIEVSRHSTPVSLGTTTADASGNFTLTGILPANTSIGRHEIVATATVSGGTVTAATAITVVATDVDSDESAMAALPDTGASQGMDLVLLAGILFLAAGMVLIRRRSPAGGHAID